MGYKCNTDAQRRWSVRKSPIFETGFCQLRILAVSNTIANWTSPLLGPNLKSSNGFSIFQKETLHPVDLTETLIKLRQERELIGRAILSLTRLESGRQRKGGRTPKPIAAVTGKRRGRPPGSQNRLRLDGAPPGTVRPEGRRSQTEQPEIIRRPQPVAE
jgi:hypothetical protein